MRKITTHSVRNYFEQVLKRTNTQYIEVPKRRQIILVLCCGICSKVVFMLIYEEGVEGVLHQRSEASDEKGVSNGYSDFSLYRVPGFIVNGTRILTLSYDDFASAGFSISENGLLQNVFL
jgi:hypothetical protein